MNAHIMISKMASSRHLALRNPAKKEADPGFSFMSI
jgi:hypothetical protein